MKALLAGQINKLLDPPLAKAVKVAKADGRLHYENTVEISMTFDVDKDGEMQLGSDLEAELSKVPEVDAKLGVSISRNVSTSREAGGTIKIYQSIQAGSPAFELESEVAA